MPFLGNFICKFKIGINRFLITYQYFFNRIRPSFIRNWLLYSKFCSLSLNLTQQLKSTGDKNFHCQDQIFFMVCCCTSINPIDTCTKPLRLIAVPSRTKWLWKGGNEKKNTHLNSAGKLSNRSFLTRTS